MIEPGWSASGLCALSSIIRCTATSPGKPTFSPVQAVSNEARKFLPTLSGLLPRNAGPCVRTSVRQKGSGPLFFLRHVPPGLRQRSGRDGQERDIGRKPYRNGAVPQIMLMAIMLSLSSWSATTRHRNNGYSFLLQRNCPSIPESTCIDAIGSHAVTKEIAIRSGK